MEEDALASIEHNGRGGEIGFIPCAGLQPIGEKFGTISEPIS